MTKNFFNQYQKIITYGLENNLPAIEILNQLYRKEFLQYLRKGIIPRVEEIGMMCGFVDYWRKGNLDTKQYQWQSEKTDCQKCNSLNGQIFDYLPNVEEIAHPNCKCKVVAININKANEIYKEHEEGIIKRDNALDNLTENAKDFNNSKINDKGEKVYYDPKTQTYKTLGRCAEYVGDVVEESFPDYKRTEKAKDCGQNLEKVGFYKVSEGKNYEVKKGDIKIYQPYEAFEKDSKKYLKSDPAGHMQIFNGEQWVSDFRQGETPRNKDIKNGKDKGLYPNAGYENSNTPSQIYRHANWQEW